MPAGRRRLTIGEHVRRAKRGDSESIAAVAEEARDVGFRTALTMLHNPEHAEDVATETALNAVRSLHTFREGARFGTWACRIALNAAKDHLKARRNREIPESQLEEEERYAFHSANAGRPDALEELVQREKARLVNAALGKLSPAHRDVVLAHLYSPSTGKENARSLGIKHETYRSRLNRALQELKKDRAL